MADPVEPGQAPVGILLVGCGNMGFALLKGWLAEGNLLRVHVVEPDASLRERAAAHGATASAAATDIPPGFDPLVVVVAVKPQYVGELLAGYKHLARKGAFFLSVAAGVTIASMQVALGGGIPIVRCMPNTPASISAGALVCCLSQQAGPREEAIARQLLSSSGAVYFVTDESLMDAITALSGSGPAYLFYFIECLTEAGIAAGLPHELAGQLALQTTYGASLLAKKSDQSPAVLRQAVTSPNGTTAAALSYLMSPEGLRRVVTDAVMAAKARSVELAQPQPDTV